MSGQWQLPLRVGVSLLPVEDRAETGGCAQAKVAVARKMAVILHAIWSDGTEFQAEGQRA